MSSHSHSACTQLLSVSMTTVSQGRLRCVLVTADGSAKTCNSPTACKAGTDGDGTTSP